MFYDQDRASMRQYFFDVWVKSKQLKSELTALEKQILSVILDHPEYHAFFQESTQSQKKFVSSWSEQEQQQLFLHLSLHLAVRDQIQLDRPVGIKNHYQQLCLRGLTPMDAEHQIMACLSQVMWEAQQNGRAIKEHDYEILLSKL